MPDLDNVQKLSGMVADSIYTLLALPETMPSSAIDAGRPDRWIGTFVGTPTEKSDSQVPGSALAGCSHCLRAP
jgi:hypothetical protein